jgi:Tfp pilus assembly protein PilV
MKIMKLLHSSRARQAGFSVVEATIALCIGSLAVGGGMALNQQQLRLVKSSRESNGASQALEERVEQLRIATWRQITDVEYLKSAYFGTKPKSATALGELNERISVTAFPDAQACTGILIEKEPSGQIRTLLSGSGLSEQRLAKVTVTTVWRGKDSRTRTRELATVISNGGISRMNLPGMGTGGDSTTTTTPTPTPPSSTPAPGATPDPGPTPEPTNGNGNGRGNVGGKSGKN